MAVVEDGYRATRVDDTCLHLSEDAYLLMHKLIVVDKRFGVYLGKSSRASNEE